MSTTRSGRPPAGGRKRAHKASRRAVYRSRSDSASPPAASPVVEPAAIDDADADVVANDREDNRLELAIGQQVRVFRRQLNLTVVDVARRAGLSAGMLSKIENGQTSPSLATLRALSSALNVPVTSLFRKFEELRDATFVQSGEGLAIERRGTRAGHQYQLLGHLIGHTLAKRVSVEPYLLSLTAESDVFPLFQHPGVEFIYMLEGVVVYRHSVKTYRLTRGDSLFFDADAPHGPEELVELPIRFLSVIVQPRGEE